MSWFVTGIDTGVGKTVVSGGLMRLLNGAGKTAYWKPVQTGTLMGDDRRELVQLTELPADRFLPSAYSFPEPVSPHLAAEKWKKKIEVSALAAAFRQHGSAWDRIVVEGAGGVLVPLNDTELMIDLIKALETPALVVSEDRLGAINHTLLTLDALSRRRIPVLGFVLTKATGQWGNKAAIERHSGIECLAEFPSQPDVRTQIGQVAGAARLREVLGLKVIPV